MSDDNNILKIPDWEQTPPLPGTNAPDLLKERKWYGTDTSGLLLDFAKPYTPPKWTLQHNGVNFAKRGDLHIVGGKAGHGKTAFMSQIMATILCGRFGNMTCQLDGNPSVLYIDTEQSEDDTIAIKNRVCVLANIDFTQPNSRFQVARLRDTTQAIDRYKQILQLIWDIHPDVVFIDGLLDVVNDYNSQDECSLIIRELMAVSTAMNVSMWCVLHENPMTDKLVGSLGSIAERKVTEVFIIRKHKAPHQDKRFQGMPNVFFEIRQTKARGKDNEDWYFIIEDREMGWSVPVEIDLAGETTEDAATIKETEEINAYLKQFNWKHSGATYTDIEKFLRSKGITSGRRIKYIFDFAKESGIIYQNDNKKYYYNGITNQLPNDEVKNLPFEKPKNNEDAPY